MVGLFRRPSGRAWILVALLGIFVAPVRAQQYTFQSVLNFDVGTVGANPLGDLLLFNNVLYGTTSQGGSNGDGTVFQYTPGATSISSSVSLNAATTGSGPAAGLTAFNGFLYGTAQTGGDASGDGTVFEYNTASNTIFNPVNLGGTNGSIPFGELVVDNGKLYGTTSADASGAGTVYALTPGAGSAAGTLSSATSFSGGTNGTNPVAGMTLFNGVLYGTASGGGANNVGTVFAYTPSSGFATPASFGVSTGTNTDNGSNPQGGLTLFNGNFYGTTQMGGSGFGTIFQYSPTAHTITNLFNFSGSNGAQPTGDLVFDTQGNLYGTTSQGGNLTLNNGNGDGTVFKFNPTTKALTTLVSFDDATFPGSTPNTGLTFVGSNLYGMTYGGGNANGDGTLFELVAPVAAPEPSSFVTLALGMLGLGALGVRARRRQRP